jgi:single-strand DNA-binding protein
MNNCIFYGRVATDIELKYSQGDSSMAIANFTIAINRKTKDRKVDFLPFTAFGKTAENMERFFRKGNRIAVRTHAQRDEYTDKDGNKRTNIKFLVDDFDIIETKAENGAQNEPAGKAPGNADEFMHIPDALSGEEFPFD